MSGTSKGRRSSSPPASNKGRKSSSPSASKGRRSFTPTNGGGKRDGASGIRSLSRWTGWQ